MTTRPVEPAKAEITFDDFGKMDIRIGSPAAALGPVAGDERGVKAFVDGSPRQKQGRGLGAVAT